MGTDDTLEIQAHAYRLMRSGNYRKADLLIKDVIRDFSDIPEVEVRSAIAQLIDRLAKD